MASNIGTLFYDLTAQDNLKKILEDDKKLALELGKVLKDNASSMAKIDLTQLRQYNSIMNKAQIDAAKLAAVNRRADDESIIRLQRLQTEIARTEAAKKRAAAVGQSGQSSYERSIGLTNKTLFSQSNLLNQLSQAAGIYFSIYQVGSFVKELYTVSGEFEKQRVSLGAILQSTEKAGVLFEQIKKLAVKSPFQFGDLVSYTKQLSAFSIPYNELYDTTKRLADISAGVGIDMSRLVLAFGQVRSASVLRGQELRQFTEAGIPLVDELAKKFTKLSGEVVTAGDVFDKISKREVSFDMVKEIFTDMTSEGGKFYNFQGIQAETLSGKISNLKDSYQMMLDEIGRGNSGAMKDSVNMLTSLMNHWEDIAKVLKTLVAVYGTYKAVLIVTNTLQAASMAISKTQYAVDMINAIRVIRGLTTVTYAQVAAQTALNFVTSINPFVAAAVGIAGLVGAIVYFSEESKTAAERLDDMNKRLAEAKLSSENLKQESEKYLKVATDVTNSYLDRENALKKLKEIMPETFKNLNLEKLAVLGLADAYELAVNASNKMAVGTARTDYYKATKDLVEKEHDLMLTGTKDKATRDSLLKDELSIQQSAKKNYLELLSQEYKAEKESHKQRQQNADWILAAQSKIGKYKAFDVRPNEGYLTYIERLQQELSDLNGEQKKLSATNQFSSKTYKEQADKIKTVTAVLKAIGGTTEKEKKGKTISPTRDNDLSAKIAREEADLIDMYKKAESKKEQAILDIKEDGYDKQLEQLKLNYDKEKLAITEESQKILKLYQDIEEDKWKMQKHKKGEVLTRTIKTIEDIPQGGKNTIDTLNKANDDKYKADKQKVYNDLLIQLNDYNAKVSKIEKDQLDEEKYLNSQRTDSNKDTIDRAISESKRLAAEQKSAIKFDELKKNTNWEEVFSDLNNVSTRVINDLQSKLTNLLSNKGDLAATEIKTIVDALEKLNEVSIERNPMDAFFKALDELNTASQEVDAAKSALKGLTEGTDEYNLANSNLSKAENKKQAALSKANKAFKIGADSVNEFAKSISDVGSVIGDELGGQLNLVSTIITSTVAGIGSIMSLVTFASTSMTATSKTASTAIKAIEKASVILAIISAAIQLAQAVVSLISGENESKVAYDNMKKSAEAYNDTIQKVIASQERMLKVLSGASAVKAYDEIKKELESNIEVQRQLAIAAGGQRSAWAHSTDYRNTQAISSFTSGISASAGQKITRIEDFYSLTPEQLYKIRKENYTAWSAISSDVKDPFDKMIELWEKIGEMSEKSSEALLGLSFDDALSSLDDFLMSADTATADVAQNFEDYMKQAMLNIVKDKMLSDSLNKWYNHFKVAMDDNKLSKDEVDSLKNEYLGIYSDAKDKMDEFSKATGIDLNKKDDKGGITANVQSLSENTGNILASYINAVRADVSVIKSLMDGSNAGSVTLKIHTIMQSYYPTITSTLALQQAELIKIQSNTLRSANNSDVIMSSLDEVKTIFKRATTSGSGVKLNV